MKRSNWFGFVGNTLELIAEGMRNDVIVSGVANMNGVDESEVYKVISV